MTLRLNLLAALALGFASPALSVGGDISGGGELLEDRINPWFVQEGTHGSSAKKIVKYCVLADEEAFGVAIPVLRKHVQAAFRFWDEELRAAYLPENGPNGSQVLVGAESYFPADTCDGASIIFQFGTLAYDQIVDFAHRGLDPQNFVALALRTEYAASGNMQGKGIVYIAPPTGPLAMRGRDVVPDTWSRDSHQRLDAILAHEIGHVFGLQHGTSTEDLMGALFPERMVSANADWDGYLPGVFKVTMNSERRLKCWPGGLPPFIAAYFSAPASDECLAVVVRDQRVIFQTRKKHSVERTVVGELTFDSVLVDREETLVALWLPEERQLFKNVTPRYGRILPGPTARHRQVSGTYVPKVGESRSLQVHLSPTRIQVGGVWNGKIILDLLDHNENPRSP